MRRYGTQSQRVTVPGQDAGLRLTLRPTQGLAVAPCAADIAGLFWFSDVSGQFDQIAEAAYLLAEGAAGPALGVAGVLGERCDLPVTWRVTWTPASGSGGDPGFFEDGVRLVVYPLATTMPGIAEISVERDGRQYGPIMLTVLRYACYVSNSLGGWLRVPENFPFDSYAGSVNQYGGADGGIVIGSGATTILSYANMAAVTRVWVYSNDGGSGYFVVNGDTVPHANNRGAFDPPWQNPAADVVTVSGLTSIELNSDDYNAPFYVFVQ